MKLLVACLALFALGSCTIPSAIKDLDKRQQEVEYQQRSYQDRYVDTQTRLENAEKAFTSIGVSLADTINEADADGDGVLDLPEGLDLLILLGLGGSQYMERRRNSKKRGEQWAALDATKAELAEAKARLDTSNQS